MATVPVRMPELVMMSVLWWRKRFPALSLQMPDLRPAGIQLVVPAGYELSPSRIELSRPSRIEPRALFHSHNPMAHDFQGRSALLVGGASQLYVRKGRFVASPT